MTTPGNSCLTSWTFALKQFMPNAHYGTHLWHHTRKVSGQRVLVMEWIDAPAFAFLSAIAQIQMHKRSPTVPSSLKIDPCDSEDACRHLKGKVVVPKVQEFLGRTGTTRNLPHI